MTASRFANRVPRDNVKRVRRKAVLPALLSVLVMLGMIWGPLAVPLMVNVGTGHHQPVVAVAADRTVLAGQALPDCEGKTCPDIAGCFAKCFQGLLPSSVVLPALSGVHVGVPGDATFDDGRAPDPPARPPRA